MGERVASNFDQIAFSDIPNSVPTKQWKIVPHFFSVNLADSHKNCCRYAVPLKNRKRVRFKIFVAVVKCYCNGAIGKRTFSFNPVISPTRPVRDKISNGVNMRIGRRLWRLTSNGVKKIHNVAEPNRRVVLFYVTHLAVKLLGRYGKKPSGFGYRMIHQDHCVRLLPRQDGKQMPRPENSYNDPSEKIFHGIFFNLAIIS